MTRNGGWDMPIIVHDAVVLEDATSAASPIAGTVPETSAASPEADAVPATSAASSKACAVPAPSQTAKVDAVPATPASSLEAVAAPAPSQTAEVDAVPAPEEVAQVVAPPLQVNILAAGDDDLVVAPLEGGN
ncbi:hypothetical protein DYB26_010892 [Aphanomyces astaci]|uniref:Uncharacterized protein n=1 Tax=Aphanomyces astaci TaxID=112090 RepID=A0A3R7BVJ2_APHAT|nr:hypothetical protein DYB26_010892 [Aphanomyces astaci]